MTVQNGIAVKPQGYGFTRLSPDGYVRLTLEQFQWIPLVHLLSDLDHDEYPPLHEGASQTHISGYTEWVSETAPVITLGWDWRMEGASGQARYLRTGLPRSNIMLVDDQRQDLGPAITAKLLEAAIDKTAWPAVIQRHIMDRYV
ncbi:DUF4902 domain-containing protein [Acidithiobacillus ferrooxidans F221]|uniref:DUF4902 domain-containing protein n=1 Tax=Acidithiobacillus ferrooxidans TaxID=920 RepID=UPI001C06783D|nr:DUF4902 domain-containing protein [Acidithiobacillus ferrooxidans]MBU2807200.1 DUF4902 domain-containing protein [Acidithiobacillus ferrooxidans F221]